MSSNTHKTWYMSIIKCITCIIVFGCMVKSVSFMIRSLYLKVTLRTEFGLWFDIFYNSYVSPIGFYGVKILVYGVSRSEDLTYKAPDI
jgi:hypothetical protein